MARILIPTINDDIHAAAVACTLERMGHRALRWRCADFPERAGISAMVGTGGRALRLGDAAGELLGDPPDICWNRRIARPTIAAHVHEADRAYALRESTALLSGAIELLSRSAFAVNAPAAARRAENKLVQLVHAREAGFVVPETLVSNDPAHIRAFVRNHERAGAVFKSLHPIAWESHDRLASLFTARLHAAQLPDDAMLRACPGIYQACIPKTHELRIACMGAEVVAARLDSQSTRDGGVDFRLAPTHELGIAPAALHLSVQQRCRDLLRRLGLVFGCIDMIVTPASEHVFLEVNPMGQFLWIEEACPEIDLLQAFCDFLVARRADFRRPRARREGIRYADVATEARAALAAERALHVAEPISPCRVRE